VQFILAKGISNDNDNGRIAEISSAHEQLEVDLFFSDSSIRLPEPTIQRNIKDGMPTRHNVPSVL
jgi:hypothetical protein